MYNIHGFLKVVLAETLRTISNGLRGLEPLSITEQDLVLQQVYQGVGSLGRSLNPELVIKPWELEVFLVNIGLSLSSVYVVSPTGLITGFMIKKRGVLEVKNFDGSVCGLSIAERLELGCLPTGEVCGLGYTTWVFRNRRTSWGRTIVVPKPESSGFYAKAYGLFTNCVGIIDDPGGGKLLAQGFVFPEITYA